MIHTTEHMHSSDKINKDMIRKMLIKYDYDLNQVAKALDMSRTTLWRYRKKFNL
jgi:transcriptional regulator of acetoin/glycerol metabolism